MSSGTTRHDRLQADTKTTVLARLLRALTLATAAAAALAASAPASAAPAVSAARDANGFPLWYQDAAGDRVTACIDPADGNCVLPTIAGDVAFPGNFPDEFFYALATSEDIVTPGCLGSPAGRASVRLALEGAFVNGAPAFNEQMAFGRVRVRVTSGLCPNTTYRFEHPFGVETIRTNDAGAVPSTLGTEDVGCLPVAPALCDFSLATSSRVFGEAGGFLRWDTFGQPEAAGGPPAGYLGDAVTPHAVSGATGAHPNAFRILDAGGAQLLDDDGDPLRTDLFTVAGKLAGSLVSAPAALDAGGEEIGGTPGPARTVTVTNVDRVSVTVPAAGVTVLGADAADFDVTADTCSGRTLARDATCSVTLRFDPRAGLAGRRAARLTVASAPGVRSPLAVALTGRALNAGDAPIAAVAPAAVAFGDVRLRTVGGPEIVTVTNTGTAPLAVTAATLTNAGPGSGAEQFRIAANTCAAGFVDIGLSCEIHVEYAPFVTGPHSARLELSTNTDAPPAPVALTGTGTGGVAAVSTEAAPPGLDTDTGFPLWYRDEAGVKLSECIDKDDPFCVVLADPFFDPARDLVFPTNFPEEYFYHVATSDNIATPGCAGTAPGRALLRTALEAAFVNGGPVDGEQMVFSRVRIVVTGGLCPNTTYTFTTPYGVERVTTNARGAVPRNAATDDVGCAPVPPARCDFALALSGRVVGGVLRWDPATGAAAPAGYIGDPNVLHRVIGAPYAPGGVPANYFRVEGPSDLDEDGNPVGTPLSLRTDEFSVMGKLLGPLEASPDPLALGVVPVGSTGAGTVTLTNTGLAPIAVTSASVPAGEFAVGLDACSGTQVPVGGTCTIDVNVTPASTGERSTVLTVRHDGLNDPVEVDVTAVGGALGGAAAFSFQPASVAFPPLHVGRRSNLRTVRISNAGGASPLQVTAVALTGAGAGSFVIADDRCGGTIVPIGGRCEVDVAFTPLAAGAVTAGLRVTDNAPGSPHTLALTGTGSAADPAVSATVDSRNGFPLWYQDGNGVRLEQCLDPADTRCIVLGDATYDTALPLAFPGNFPGEFFWTVADSDAVATPGCYGPAGEEISPPGTASLRVALEGTFVDGAPVAGDQMTFGRVRVSVTSGLCPGAHYKILTPYGPYPFTADDSGGTFVANAAGGIARNAGTEDIGCGPVAPATCDFSEALTSRMAQSFLRWDPGSGAAAPAGYLGDAVTLHEVVGGTWAPAGASEPVDYFQIIDTAGNSWGRTDLWTVSGKLAGPLQGSVRDVAFPDTNVGDASPGRTVTFTNVGDAPLGITSVTLGGAQPGQFQIAGATCSPAAPALLRDGACTVTVRLAPTGAPGPRSATLTVTPATGPAVTVALSGAATPAPLPKASVSPGVLPFGTVTAGGPAALLTVTVGNLPSATAPLVVGAPAIGGANPGDYAVTGSTCGAPVAPGLSCAITVRFTPTAIGLRTAQLTIPHNDAAAGGSAAVSLTGTGNGSTFSMSPNPVTFGSGGVGSTKTQTITVKNTGTLAFTPGAATINPAGVANFAVTSNLCSGLPLAPGRSCQIQVRFTVTAVGAFTGTLTLQGAASSLPGSQRVTLTGTGK